jgi:hypothetical protein
MTPTLDDIDLGRFNDYDSTDSFIRGTLDYGKDLNHGYKNLHSLGKTCPGPGYGEPECGCPITDDSERCHTCTMRRRKLEEDPRARYAIHERPRHEVDSAKYAARLHARAVQIPKLLALAEKRKRERENK